MLHVEAISAKYLFNAYPRRLIKFDIQHDYIGSNEQSTRYRKQGDVATLHS